MKIDDLDKMWITRVLDAGWRIKVKSPLVASIIFFGLPIDILLAIFLSLRKNFISPQFFLAYILCVLWLNLGPYFIWRYERKLMATFFDNLDGLLPPRDVRRLYGKYRKNFSKKFWIPIIPWMFFLFAVYSNGFILDTAGTFGFRDIWAWLLSIPIIWIPIIAGMGTWGVITTLMAINEIARKNLKLDSLHTDRRGGLGCIGNYAIGTTILISSGSLFLPMAFQLASHLGSAKTSVYILVSFFIGILLLSFFYPVFITQAGASVRRKKLLEDLRKRYNRILREQESSGKGGRSKLECYLDAVRVRTEYADLASINLYPFDISIINKLVSSIFFPVLITFVQQLIGF